MKFKLFALATIFSFFAISSFAQNSAADQDAETDAVLTLLGIQKKEAVAQLVNIEKKDSAAFWKIYNEYLGKNKQNAKERVLLYEKTAQAYSNMNGKTADSLATKFFKQRFEQEKHIEDYYKKMKEAINPVIAFQFYQAEVYLLTMMRAQIYQQIPTYGQLMNATKK